MTEQPLNTWMCGQNIFLTEGEKKNTTQQDTCQKFNPPLSSSVQTSQDRTHLHLRGWQYKIVLIGGENQNASFCDWVRRWVLTQKSPWRLFYLSKAQFHLFGTKAACSCCKGRTCHSAHVCHPRGSWKAERRTTDSQSLASLLHKPTRPHANKSNRDTLASLHLAEFSRLADLPVCSVYAGVGAFASKHGEPGWCSRCWCKAGMQGTLPGAASQLCCRCK